MNKKISAAIILVVLSITLLTACKCKHEFTSANCLKPATCTICGETSGEALGHSWSEATCEKPATCTICGEAGKEPLGHNVEQWDITKEPTCSESGIQVGQCSACGKNISSEIEKLKHTPGDWEVETAATSSSSGKRIRYCTICSAVVDEETYELTEEEKAESFKQECEKYSYNKIARNPDDYLLKPVKFTGEVIQVLEDGDSYTLRVNVTKKRYYWTDTILVQYTKKDSSEPRILEDDIITLYGYSLGTSTYETVMGSSVTIPAVMASYIDIK